MGRAQARVQSLVKLEDDVNGIKDNERKMLTRQHCLNDIAMRFSAA
jgi:hypothetical protein